MFYLSQTPRPGTEIALGETSSKSQLNPGMSKAKATKPESLGVSDIVLTSKGWSDKPVCRWLINESPDIGAA